MPTVFGFKERSTAEDLLKLVSERKLRPDGELSVEELEQLSSSRKLYIAKPNGTIAKRSGTTVTGGAAKIYRRNRSTGVLTVLQVATTDRTKTLYNLSPDEDLSSSVYYMAWQDIFGDFWTTPIGGGTFLFGKMDANITNGSTGTMSIWIDNADSGANQTVRNRTGQTLLTGVYMQAIKAPGWAEYMVGPWELDACP